MNSLKDRAMKFLKFLILFVGLAGAKDPKDKPPNAIAPPDQAMTCIEHFDADRSLKELVHQATYIALFNVGGASMDNPSKFGPDNHIRGNPPTSYTYYMMPVLNLKGKAPPLLEFTGMPPQSFAPQVYFVLDERHELLVNSNSERVGLAIVQPLANGGHCIATSTLMINYDYLIFGGITSKAGLEPIHSTDSDPFYLEVLRLLVEASP